LESEDFDQFWAFFCLISEVMLDGVSALGCRARLVDRIVMTFKAKQNLQGKDVIS